MCRRLVGYGGYDRLWEGSGHRLRGQNAKWPCQPDLFEHGAHERKRWWMEVRRPDWSPAVCDLE